MGEGRVGEGRVGEGRVYVMAGGGRYLMSGREQERGRE